MIDSLRLRTIRLLGLAVGLLLFIAASTDARAVRGADLEHGGRAPRRAAEPLDAAAQAWVDSTLSSLDLRQRVAQLVFPWIPGGRIPAGSAELARIRGWLEEERVGGLIVSRGPAGEFAPMMNRLQSLSSVPLLIVSDLETGPGMRLTGGTAMPPAMAFGAAGSEALARAAGAATAREARAAGIHVTLGPVLDVNSNPFNPIINTRSFGEDPDAVAAMASAWIAGAREEGLLTVGKHFPGHGATEVDSHMGLPTVDGSLEALLELELVPFAAAVEGGLDGLLVGHIAVPGIDGPGAPPASLSPAVIGGLVRDRFGFDGLVFTDALNMGAITEHYSVPEASILALRAGADVLLQPPGEGEVIDSVVAAVEEGRLEAGRIEAAARRVLSAKARAGLHTGVRAEAGGGRPPPEHESLAEGVAVASITLARDRDSLVPLPSTARNVLHVTYTAGGSRSAAGTTDRVLASADRSVTNERVDDRTTAAAYRRIAERARAADLVIVSASLVPKEYRGPLALRDDFSRLVEGLVSSGVPVVAVSFGSPYLLDFFPSVSTYLLAWSATADAQRAAARALLGEAPIRGRLPVSLPPHHAIGEGLTRGGSRER